MRQSIWQCTSPQHGLQPLTTNKKCDVCIVGGGLTGIYTAFLLAQHGYHTILLEGSEQIAQGTTGLSTGKLTTQHGLFYSKLQQQDGLLFFQSQQGAIERALQHLPNNLYNQADSYLYATTEKGEQALQKEFEAYKSLNIRANVTTEIELPMPIKLALKIEHQTQINPVTVTQHFAGLAQKFGCEIYSQTRVTHIDPNKSTITTNKNLTVDCNKIILCTHYPIESLRQLLLLKLAINRSYLTATPITELLQGQYLSVDAQARTARTATINGENYFIYGGGGHLAGTVKHTESYYATLQKELAQQFDLQQPTYMWSAQDVTTADLLPYVGQLTEHLYIATGFRKWGLSNSFVAGELLTSQLRHEKQEVADLFHPKRHLFGETLLQMMMQAGFVGEQLISGYSTRMTAPKCTHLGCKTNWNEGDQTWDCPCHGSRYNKDGHVIEGPAVYPLKLKKLR